MSEDLITVACVLKTGGDFQIEHVALLKGMVDQHLTLPHRFVCLTDKPMEVAMQVGCTTHRLTHNWPGWWSKLELFEHEMGFVFYMDLDTVIRKNIDWIEAFVDGKFWMLQNRPKTIPPIGGSGIMAWTGAKPHIPDNFTVEQIPSWASTTDARWGDQGWIWHRVREEVGIMDDRFPEEFASFKMDIGKKHGAKDPSIVFFHGQPRPWMVKDPMVSWSKTNTAGHPPLPGTRAYLGLD